MNVICVFTEGEFDEFWRTEMSALEASGYCRGLAAGADKFGGSASAYFLPDDLPIMKEDKGDRKCYAAAIKAWEALQSASVPTAATDGE